MKRTAFHLGVALLTFLVGIAPVRLHRVTRSETPVLNRTRFIPTGSLINRAYTIHWFAIQGSPDPQAITFFSELGSGEKARYLFESNAAASELIERGEQVNARGQRVGERGVALLGGERRGVRVFWTEGVDFWCIQAPTLEIAFEFEGSWLMYSAKSNKAVPPTHSSTDAVSAPPASSP